MQARLKGQAVFSFQSFYENYWAKVPVFTIDANWFAFSEGFSIIQSQINLRLKRLGDILISVPCLILSLPIMLLVAIIVRLESRGDAIFKQERVGVDRKPFTIYKFRSMARDAEKDGPQLGTKK